MSALFSPARAGLTVMGRHKGVRGMVRGLAATACLLLVLACSRPAEPPRRLFGLAFGDAPTADLKRRDVPLPSGLSEDLAFFAAPGRRETGWADVALADPVLAFYRGRLFSVDAALADGAAATRLLARLTKDFGPPLCREAGHRAVCLWSAGEMEMILESGAGSPARLMVRHGPTAAALVAASPQAAGARLGDEP